MLLVSGSGISTDQTSGLLIRQNDLVIQKASYGWIGSVRRDAGFRFGQAWINTHLQVCAEGDRDTQISKSEVV